MYAQAYDLTPEEAEERVRQEWELRELRRLESAKHARTLEQRLEQTRAASEAVRAAGTQSSRGAAQSVPTKTQKRAYLQDEPAPKRRKRDSQAAAGGESHRPPLTVSFEEPTTEDILSQAATPPQVPQSEEAELRRQELRLDRPAGKRQEQQTSTSAKAGGRVQPSRSSKRAAPQSTPPGKKT